jgi:hypothetical protein
MEGDEGLKPVLGIGDAVERLIEPFQQLVHVDLYQVEQEVLLGGDMVIEGAGLDADLGREPPQAHGLVTLAVDQPEPRLADRLHRLGAIRSDRARHGAALSFDAICACMPGRAMRIRTFV